METAFVSWVSIFSPLDNGGKWRHSFICQLLIKGPLTAETSSLSSYEHNALEKAKLLHPSYLRPRQHSTICQQRWADSRSLCCLCGLSVGLESGSESTLKISFSFCFIKALWLWEGSRKLTSLQEMCCDLSTSIRSRPSETEMTETVVVCFHTECKYYAAKKCKNNLFCCLDHVVYRQTSPGLSFLVVTICCFSFFCSKLWVLSYLPNESFR